MTTVRYYRPNYWCPNSEFAAHRDDFCRSFTNAAEVVTAESARAARRLLAGARCAKHNTRPEIIFRHSAWRGRRIAGRNQHWRFRWVAGQALWTRRTETTREQWIAALHKQPPTV